MTRSADTDPAAPGSGHADRLARELAANGSVRSAAWRRAFAHVPRHLFVPAFHLRTDQGTTAYTDRTPGWLEAIYSDATLITRFSPDGLAASSSTEPSLMASMLEHLQVQDGMKVLEVGTGTGYNAALLSERLGSGLVTSIDVDRALVAQARQALEAAGYRPTLAVMDGTQGYPPNAPYQRILATCGLGRVPTAWLGQLDGDGLVLANVGLGMALLRKEPDGHARGRFLPDAAGFMRLRSISVPGVPALDRVLSAAAGEPDRVHQEARVPGLDDHAMAEFLLSLLLPYALRMVQHRQEHEVHCVLDGASGAWWRAEVDGEGNATVGEGGGHLLWAPYRALLRSWDEAGRPGIGRYGLTVDPDGRHHLWLDTPDTPSIALDHLSDDR
ncbi:MULTISPECIES: methyltransferase domain-containing protein [unclassified Nocardiopsis]|uniref:methyltransferase domain-containing protein n=1 Tax=Nocardiopsis TaxID=2013 RepID=UPI00387AFC81